MSLLQTTLLSRPASIQQDQRMMSSSLNTSRHSRSTTAKLLPQLSYQRRSVMSVDLSCKRFSSLLPDPKSWITVQYSTEFSIQSSLRIHSMRKDSELNTKDSRRDLQLQLREVTMPTMRLDLLSSPRWNSNLLSRLRSSQLSSTRNSPSSRMVRSTTSLRISGTLIQTALRNLPTRRSSIPSLNTLSGTSRPQ